MGTGTFVMEEIGKRRSKVESVFWMRKKTGGIRNYLMPAHGVYDESKSSTTHCEERKIHLLCSFIHLPNNCSMPITTTVTRQVLLHAFGIHHQTKVLGQ